MDPVGLGELLKSLPHNEDPNLIVGFSSSDDAGVYRLDDETAIITTADFITPPVDDPYLFGRIAAANAISDVYAMGGRPITCINLVAFPSGKLGPEILSGIVAGGLSIITEAGAVLAGGHTIEDDEPKYGLAVTGIVHPKRVWTNTGARAGDHLILTKPIGSGVLFNANLKGWVSREAMKACTDALVTLNRRAAEVMAGFDIHSVTDVTGFGLAGHGFEMAKGSGIRIEIEMNRLPVMSEALDMYRKGMTTGANAANRRMVKGHARFDADLPDWHLEIVFDPQTSGGLLAAVAPEDSPRLVDALRKSGVDAACRIGTAEPVEGGIYLVFR
ncbi:MAG: selenide, water dikinase SelD [Desulfobacterales bacterium]